MKKLFLVLLLFSLKAFSQENWQVYESISTHENQCEFFTLINAAKTKLKQIQLSSRSSEGIDINFFLANELDYNHIGEDINISLLFDGALVESISSSSYRKGIIFETHLKWTLSDTSAGIEKYNLKDKIFFKWQPPGTVIEDCIAENPIVP